MNKKSFFSSKKTFILLTLLSIVLIFIFLPKENREPFAYAIFITIIISGADSLFFSILWKKIKGKDKNPLI